MEPSPPPSDARRVAATIILISLAFLGVSLVLFSLSGVPWLLSAVVGLWGATGVAIGLAQFLGLMKGR